MSAGPATAAGEAPPAPKRRRRLETPEGVLLSVTLPEHGSRAVALALDITFWSLATAGLWILTLIAYLGGDGSGLLVPFFVLVSGLVRNFYFLFFELKWQGQTPGKRIMKLRVVDNRGGPLLPQAVIARNLMREIEITLPLSIVLMASTGSLGGVLLLLWLGIFALFPLFNRDRMRCGDLIAGTWVIEVPDAKLAPDLAAPRQRAALKRPADPPGQADPDAPAFSFSDHQLRRYETRHLQVLEEVLRRPDDAATRDLHRQIAVNIARKIGFEPAPPETQALAFLTAFYAQFRNRLELTQVYHGTAERES